MPIQKFVQKVTILKACALAAALALAVGLRAGEKEDGLKLMQGSDCFSCHSVDNKIVGPAYKDVAKKYKGANAGQVAKLASKIKAGGSGNWGAVPMAAHPQFSEDEIQKMVKWILAVKPGMKVEAAAPAPAPKAESHESKSEHAAQPAPENHEAAVADEEEQDVSKLMEKYECFGCHAAGQELPWPDMKTIARTYKGKPSVVVKLAAKLKTGGAGRWGKVPQVPYPHVSDATLQRLVTWMIANGETFVPGTVAAAPVLDAGKMSGSELVKASDCLSCHSVDNKIVGPSYKDVAKKYKGKGPQVVATLVKKVKAGGSGNWGAVPMVAHPTLSDAAVEKMVKWVLEQ